MAGKELKVGDAAPDFTLKDHNGKEVSLRSLRGKKVLMGFHPMAWTSVCAQQMSDLETSADELEKLGAVALGLSIDSSPSKHLWAKILGISRTPLLADFWPHGGVAASYGVFRDAEGIAERSAFVIGADGTVKFKKIYPIGQRPDIRELVAAVAKA
jgi:peroxiredoxin